MTRAVSVAQLAELQKDARRVRNLCIVAHVDHGKTTLADSLVASNGIISQRMSGKLRYMDSRPDEQERGITMKSSAVALAYRENDEDYLLNLIDSPGHVDFSSEVSTAVRLCDGAILVVDVVEGVQPQTKVVLQQAWREDIKPVLVLNKMDRLITEMKLTPLDAFIHLGQVLEQVNAVLAELFTEDVMTRMNEEKQRERKLSSNNKDLPDQVFDWSDGLEEADDSELYFSPDRGNVIFASAYDGWGFDIHTFASIYSKKLGFNINVLRKTLWGDYYINMKTKKILRGAQGKAKKPLFVQLVLDNIWALYDTIYQRKDKEKLLKVIETLNLSVTNRDLRSTDPRQQLNAVFSAWLPLAPCLLSMVCQHLPAPTSLSEDRVEKLMCSKARKFETLPKETQQLKQAFLKCSSAEVMPTIVFVSKMFPVDRKQLPENRPKPLSAEEMAARREAVKQRLEKKSARERAEEANQSAITLTQDTLQELKLSAECSDVPEAASSTTFLAFARVFSGTLTPGDDIYVLGPKHDPEEALSLLREGKELCPEGANVRNLLGNQSHVFKAKVGTVYLMLGKELQDLKEVPAGNVCAVGGLEDYILKSATISSVPACPPFVEITHSAQPILRVAVEPERVRDSDKLEQGLKLLNQADANVMVSITDKGEHILVTAGEVHLERCLRDLEETYAGVKVNCSAPLVPFRETIIEPPKKDMVNEQLNEENKVVSDLSTNADTDKRENSSMTKTIEIQTPDKRCTVRIRAFPLPDEVVNLLDTNLDILRSLSLSKSSLSSDSLGAINKLKSGLNELLKSSYCFDGISDPCDTIMSFGPRKIGPNVLFNLIPSYNRPSIWPRTEKQKDSPNEPVALFEYDSSIIGGFQLATLSGPLCEEPLRGVGYAFEACHVTPLSEGTDATALYGPLSGQILSTMKEGCRRAFQAQPQRLMAAMYSCDIAVKSEVLGKLFASVGKRNGRVVKEDLIEGSSTFNVTAHIPVVESFQFAQEIRRQTSGLAMPQLVFSHWELIELDPFWEPQTEEELLHFGEKADYENRARIYMNGVRKRKGLKVDEKLVEVATKQRTLTKMK